MPNIIALPLVVGLGVGLRRLVWLIADLSCWICLPLAGGGGFPANRFCWLPENHLFRRSGSHHSGGISWSYHHMGSLLPIGLVLLFTGRAVIAAGHHPINLSEEVMIFSKDGFVGFGRCLLISCTLVWATRPLSWFVILVARLKTRKPITPWDPCCACGKSGPVAQVGILTRSLRQSRGVQKTDP